jgi:hypothetical protein
MRVVPAALAAQTIAAFGGYFPHQSKIKDFCHCF